MSARAPATKEPVDPLERCSDAGRPTSVCGFCNCRHGVQVKETTTRTRNLAKRLVADQAEPGRLRRIRHAQSKGHRGACRTIHVTARSSMLAGSCCYCCCLWKRSIYSTAYTSELDVIALCLPSCPSLPQSHPRILLASPRWTLGGSSHF